MKKFIISLFFFFLVLDYVNKPGAKVIDILSNNEQQNSDVSIINSIGPTKGNYDLTALNIVLPVNWLLNTRDRWQYNFVDNNGRSKGWVIVEKYKDNAFSEWKPNHSETTDDELIDIPLGKCRVFTLDVDNGTAASGITGTHNDYYAIIPVKGNIRYIVEFSQNDKRPQTKEQFLKILKNLSFL